MSAEQLLHDAAQNERDADLAYDQADEAAAGNRHALARALRERAEFLLAEAYIKRDFAHTPGVLV